MFSQSNTVKEILVATPWLMVPWGVFLQSECIGIFQQDSSAKGVGKSGSYSDQIGVLHFIPYNPEIVSLPRIISETDICNYPVNRGVVLNKSSK